MLILILAVAIAVLAWKVISVSGRVKALEEKFRRRAESWESAPVAPPQPVRPLPAAPAEEPKPLPLQPTELPPPSEKPSRIEWEAVLGGNWLNKAGVVLLIIGLALFLSYSFSRLGPEGRVALASGVSAAMLGVGVAAERRENYRVFGHGLIGGGWAGLYSTAYAVHALDAARIIESPFVGTLVLVVVAAGMIGHSLRYRSEAVSGIAYILAFLALGVSGVSEFALGASVVLAGSLLWLSHRFGWTRLALTGRPATYGLFLVHTIRVVEGNIIVAQTLLVIYWLLFEGFDILRARLRRRDFASLLQFPANAAAFVTLSFLVWQGRPDFWIAPALAAALYLTGMIARAWLLDRGSVSSVEDVLVEGHYFGSLAVAAALAAIAILSRFSGATAALALLLEGQILFLAACRLRREFPNTLAAGVFAAAVVRSLLLDSHTALAGHDWRTSSLLAVLAATTFAVNRWLRGASSHYGRAAAALVAVVLAFEVPDQWLAVALLALTAVLLELPADFRLPAAVIGLIALIPLGANNLSGAAPGDLPWAPQLVASILLAGIAVRIHFAVSPGSEGRLWRLLAAGVGAVTFLVFLWNVVPPPLLALVWTALAWILYLTGRRFDQFDLRFEGYLAAGLVFWRTLSRDFPDAQMYAGIPLRVITGALIILSFYALEILAPRFKWPAALRRIDLLAPHVIAIFATVLWATLLAIEVSGRVLTLAWAGQGVAILAAGFLARIRPLRLSGLALLLLCIGKVFFFDLRNLETPYRIASFLLLGAFLIAVSWFYSRFRKQWQRYLGD